MPMVIRIPYGGGIGAVEHHSESPEAYFAHTAGLRVLTPSDPQAAYLTIQQAIACDDPVVFFEPKRRYWDKGEVDETLDASTPAVPDPWRARVVRTGTDVTVACYGPMVRTCLEAAEASSDVSLEVVDLQSLSPLDLDTLAHSVERTGRLVVVHEASGNVRHRRRGRCAASPSAASTRWRRPCCGSPATTCRIRPSRLEEHFLPDLDRVLDAVDRAMAY